MRAGADNRELHRRQTNNNMRRQKDKISHRTGQKKYGRKPQADTGQDTLEGFGRRELRIQEFMPGPGEYSEKDTETGRRPFPRCVAESAGDLKNV